jgi:hypothetical protein
MNVRKDKPLFLSRLAVIQPDLPEWYAKHLKTMFPYKRSRFYSIKGGKTVDFEVLEEMERLVSKLQEKTM